MSTVTLINGEHAYDVIVGANTRLAPRITVDYLAEQFPADFANAVEVVEPYQWRLLYEVHHYPIYALANPAFDPLHAILDVLEEPENTNHVCLDDDLRLGPSIEDFADRLREQLSDVPADVQKAVWCILAGAKQAGMDEDQIALDSWWRTWPRNIR